MLQLAQWDSFYVIVGSAAGALIGLQFVVMTLIAVRPPQRASDAAPAFTTPTIVHFSAVLLLSALVRVPWETAAAAGTVLWGLLGFAGAVYTIAVARRMYKQDAYRPVFEDWMFHAGLPLLAYLLLALSPFAAAAYPRESLFAVGAAALLLLFSAIHNAWDGVAYHVFVHMAKAEKHAADSGRPGSRESQGGQLKP